MQVGHRKTATNIASAMGVLGLRRKRKLVAGRHKGRRKDCATGADSDKLDDANCVSALRRRLSARLALLLPRRLIWLMRGGKAPSPANSHQAKRETEDRARNRHGD